MKMKLERYRSAPVDFRSWEESREAMDGNWDKLRRIDRQAKEHGSLLGRYITEPHADGQAVYQITRVVGGKVRISVCSGLGDDWVIPYWGISAVIKRSYAEESIRRRDGISDLFRRKSA